MYKLILRIIIFEYRLDVYWVRRWIATHTQKVSYYKRGFFIRTRTKKPNYYFVPLSGRKDYYHACRF